MAPPSRLKLAPPLTIRPPPLRAAELITPEKVVVLAPEMVRLLVFSVTAPEPDRPAMVRLLPRCSVPLSVTMLPAGMAWVASASRVPALIRVAPV